MRSVRSMTAVFLLLGLFLVAIASTELYAASDGYPTRTITIIVPFPPGGVTDLAARSLADAMEKNFKQPVVVMNKAGGGATIGGYAVASAKPDGYTLGFFPVSSTIPEGFEFFQKAPYTGKDLKPISGVVSPFFAVTVKADAPWNSFKELLEAAKKEPRIKAGTAGKQTLQHMYAQTLNRTEKTLFVPVPFAGDPANLAALLGGHTQVALCDFSVVRSVADAKKVKVLAVIHERRADFAPDVPTVKELGYPVNFISVLGLVGPKDMPEEIVEKLDSMVGKICKEPDFQARILNTSLQIYYKNSADYQAHLAKYKENVLAYFKEEGMAKN